MWFKKKNTKNWQCITAYDKFINKLLIFHFSSGYKYTTTHKSYLTNINTSKYNMAFIKHSSILMYCLFVFFFDICNSFQKKGKAIFTSNYIITFAINRRPKYNPAFNLNIENYAKKCQRKIYTLILLNMCQVFSDV